MRGRIAFLLVLGVLHVLADALSLPTLARLAGATAASPPPVKPAEFRVALELEGAPSPPLTITAEHYPRIEGPPARRQLYETVLAEGPRLEADPTREPMLRAVLPALLCGSKPVLGEMGFGVAPARVRLRYQPREGPAGRSDVTVLGARCR